MEIKVIRTMTNTRITKCILFEKKLWIACTMILYITNLIFANNPKIISKNVKFTSEGVTLSGTIIKPKNPVAALVIVHGSGQEKRMMEFATNLSHNGFAVLTYDKRGVGESGGVYAGPEVGTNNVDSTNLNLLALDASAATNTLMADIATKHIKMGLIGCSQAGWVIPLTAQKNENVNFMVIFSGPLITVKEQLRFQFYTNNDDNFWETHTEDDARFHIANDEDRYQFIDVDPRVALSTLAIPCLWIYGQKDIQVPVNLSIERLEILKLKNNRYHHQLYPDLGHNTAFTDSTEPVENAVKWIRSMISSMQNKN